MPSTPTLHRKNAHHKAAHEAEHAGISQAGISPPDLDATAVADARSDELGRSAVHDPRECDETGSHDLAVEPRQDGVGAVSGLDWPVLIWIVGVHLAALTAPFCFSWSGLAICLTLYYLSLIHI